jgi:hypothetical protein
MRLTIWQQFSSNHSASFTVVGVFKDSEKAKCAKEELEDIFKRITAWYDEDKERWAYIYELSPVENELREQYQLQWDSAIAWFFHAKIAIQDNVLAISTYGQADSGAYPIDLLLGKFGANVAVDGERIRFEQMRFGILDISCIAPNKEIAEILIKLYSGSYEAIEGKEQVLLKLRSQHISLWSSIPAKPEWFSLLIDLKVQGCMDIQMSVSDTELGDWDDYDRLYEELDK